MLTGQARGGKIVTPLDAREGVALLAAGNGHDDAARRARSPGT